MAEEAGTHVIYKGKHYIIPGQHGPEEAYRRVLNLTSSGPKLQAGTERIEDTGLEDTSAAVKAGAGEVAAILERYHDPNRARDLLPKLAEFAVLYGAIPGLAGIPGRAAGALRGLSVGQKAAAAGKAVVKAGAYGAAGAAANEGLQAVGVPRGVSEAVVGAAGLATKPGRAMLKAGAQALAGEAAAAPAVAASVAPVATEAEQIAAQLIKWKEAGLSGGQMVSSLRQVYGISPKVGGPMVKAMSEAPAVVAGKAVLPTAADEPANLVMSIQQRMKTPGGAAAVKDWLSKQPPEVAAQIKALLARGQAGSPTIHLPTAEQALAQKPGYALAKALGQI